MTALASLALDVELLEAAKSEVVRQSFVGQSVVELGTSLNCVADVVSLPEVV